jgi:hypothetical protein
VMTEPQLVIRVQALFFSEGLRTMNMNDVIDDDDEDMHLGPVCAFPMKMVDS